MLAPCGSSVNDLAARALRPKSGFGPEIQRFGVILAAFGGASSVRADGRAAHASRSGKSLPVAAGARPITSQLSTPKVKLAKWRSTDTDDQPRRRFSRRSIFSPRTGLSELSMARINPGDRRRVRTRSIHAENVAGDVEQVLHQRYVIGAIPWRLDGLEECQCRIVCFFDLGEDVEAVGAVAKALAKT